MKKSEMDRVFSKLEIEKVPCRHHVKGYYCIDGTRMFPVYYSFGSGDMPKFVEKKLANTMSLTVSELKKMARCKISAEQFKTLLLARTDL